MKIILGVFGIDFDALRGEQKAIEYRNWDWLGIDDNHPKNPFDSMVLNEVCHNLDACDECVFDVTHLKLPFTEDVVTLKELFVVIHNDEYFNKTTFFVKRNPVNKNKLKELFLLNEPIEFSDYSELFILS